MNDFLNSVRSLELPSGTAALWWMGQMGLLLKIRSTIQRETRRDHRVRIET